MHFLILSSLTQLVSNEIHDPKRLLITLFIGAVAGFLAQVLTPGKGYGSIITIVIGMAGGFLGTILFGKYLALTNNLLLNHIIYATAGAFIITLIFNLISGNDEKDSTAWKA